MKAGQRVSFTVDAYDHTYTGKVVAVGGASGARFSVLPPENATGNYVKVVQRIPVRINIDPGQNADHRLPSRNVSGSKNQISTRSPMPDAPEVWKPKYNPWAIAFVVALAAFMEVLDTSIANVALPHLAGATLAQVMTRAPGS